MKSSWWTVAFVGAVTAACSSSSSSSGGGSGGDFCLALEAQSDCKGGLQQCEDALKANAIDQPQCVSDRDAFLSCLSGETLACPSVGTVYAGAGPSSGKEYGIYGYTAWVGPDCQDLGDTWSSCQACSQAPGYGQDGADVGSKCASSSECVVGFSCVFGLCTRKCTDDSECMGRSVDANGVCVGGAGASVRCDGVTGVCLPDCGSNADCQAYEADGFCPGYGATTSGGVGEGGRCYFGDCPPSYYGCAIKSPPL